MARPHSKADAGIKVLNINLSCNVTRTEYLDAYRRCRVGWLIGKGYIYIYINFTYFLEHLEGFNMSVGR